MRKNSFCEIDLAKITRNYLKIKAFVNKKVIAVVKADAYGHGAVEVAKALQNAGCRYFAVADVSEGKELRKNGIKGEIIILGYSPAKLLNDLLEFDLTQTIVGKEYAKGFYGKIVKVQLAIDTGMRRTGIRAGDENCLETIKEISEKCRLTGLYTHLCSADEEKEDEFSKKQTESFLKITESLEENDLEIHCLNTAGTLRGFSAGNAVRIGLGLYGISPIDGDCSSLKLETALEWKSVISSVRRIKKGDSVGYGRSFIAPRDMAIATVCTGYADGYPRALSNRGFVMIGGKRARIVGRICMDSFTVDITDIPLACEGTLATLVGDGISAKDISNRLSTIPYEVLSRIGARVERVYLNK